MCVTGVFPVLCKGQAGRQAGSKQADRQGRACLPRTDLRLMSLVEVTGEHTRTHTLFSCPQLSQAVS